MAFNARFTRREAGGYNAAYGKGSKTLNAVLEQVNGKWGVTEGFGADSVTPDKKVSVVKAAWAVLTEAGYGAEPEPVPPPRGPRPPSLRKSAGGADHTEAKGMNPPAFGPPSLRKKFNIEAFPTPDLAPEGAATCPHCHRPFFGWTWEPWAGDHKRTVPPCRCNHPNEADYTPDPLDWRMWGHDEAGQYRKLSETGALDIVYHWMMRNREYVMTDGKLDRPWKEIQETLWAETGYAEYRPEMWQ